MASSDVRENVLLNLRSVTQSCKGGVPFNRLQEDYELLLGSPIPFRELGYTSLESFLRDIPDVVSLNHNAEGRLVVEGVADASTAHIVSLISRQKRSDTKKKRFQKSYAPRRNMPRYASREGYHSRSPNKQYSNTSYSRPPVQPHVQRPVQPAVLRPVQPPSQRPVQQPVHQPIQHSKPKYKSDEVPQRKFEVPPRFLKQKSSPILETPPSPVPPQEYPPSPSNSVQNSVKSAKRNATNTVVEKSPIRSLTKKPLILETHRTTQLNALESASTAKEFIDTYAKINNLTAEYRTKVMGQKKHNKSFISTLVLGERKFILYPESKPSGAAAEEAVANIAMEEIKKENLAKFPETAHGNAEEITILVNRIEEIVYDKPTGMFATGIVREYENKFHEALPKNWIELSMQNPHLDFEELDIKCGKIPDGANIIVRPSKDLSSGRQTPSSTSSKSEYAAEEETKALKNSLLNIFSVKVPEIKLPEGNAWEVYITNVTDWFSARLLDYNDDFLVLSNEMSEHYKNRDYPVENVVVSQVYAACLDDNPSIWHRVIVDEINNDQMYCYFVDEGDFTEVRRENLQEIDSRFLQFPYQAIQISLNGIEELANCISLELLEKYLLGKTLIAEVTKWRPLHFFPDISGIHRTSYSVILHDTSDGFDLNLNLFFKRYVVESLVCKLPKLSATACAYLSYVNPKGQIYLRLNTEEDCLVEQELKRLAPDFEEACMKTEVPSSSVMCAAKYQGVSWHRAVMTQNQVPYPDMVEVFFVDFGQLDCVKKYEICALEPVSEILASVASQALMCELHDVIPPNRIWTEATTEALMSYAPSNQELIVRVMCEGTPPKVKLYKRNQKLDIVSINHLLSSNLLLFKEKNHPQTLNLDDQVRKLSLKNTLSNNIPDVAFSAEELMAKQSSIVSPVNIEWLNTPDNIKSPEAFETLCNVPIELPTIPEEGQYLDVFVTLAANPHNFVVQPLNFCQDLDKLMSDMKQFYSNDDNLLEIDFNMLRNNDYYALLHTDKSWYRVRIDKIFSADMIIVYFVDFGDFKPVDVTKLQPLYNQFKRLPRLAMKASLSGVKPVTSDWDPQQTLIFCNMITEKSLVSIIRKKDVLAVNIPEYTLELVLVDTTDKSKDVYIHEILIDKQIAKAV